MALSIGKSSKEQLWVVDNPGTVPVKNYQDVFTLESLILSRGHNVDLLGVTSIGGPFQLMKHWREFDIMELDPYYRSGQARWIGGRVMGNHRFLATPNQSEAQTQIATLDGASYAAGAHAIAASNPVRPEMELMTALLELAKEGLPKTIGHTFWREGTSLAKNAGDEYLNVEFGWKPLIRDVQNFARVVMSANSIMANYERGAGQRSRRTFHVPEKPGTIVANVNNAAGTFPSMGSVFNVGKREEWTLTSNQMWFEGAFRYYLPESGLGRFSREASKLFGLDLGPSQLWNLAPWTWAADWFGNIGDVLANIQYLGPDACVMEWGYMMHHQMQQRISTSTMTGRGMSSTSGHPQIVQGQVYRFNVVDTIEYKTRIEASPYYFALNPAPLTLKQSAILVALGLSKLA